MTTNTQLDYIPLFPTPLFKTHLPVPDGVVEYWKGKSLTIPTHQKTALDGWQSKPQYIWSKENENEQPRVLEKFIETLPIPMRMTTWWVNILPPGARHERHFHPGADLVFVWYFTNATGLVLQHPQFFAEGNLMGAWNCDQTHYNSSATITAAKGDLIIFPAHMQHLVLPNESESDRIALAGNIHIINGLDPHSQTHLR